MRRKAVIIFVIILSIFYISCSDKNGLNSTNISSSSEILPTSAPILIPTQKIVTPEPTQKPSIEPDSVNDNDVKIDNYQDYYEITQDKDGNYIITLYDKKKKIIDTFSFPNEPSIGVLEKDVLQITISCGSPCNYTYFYNTETSDISDLYYNISYVEKDKVVYMDGGKLIISDIFDKTKYYKEIIRDFSPAAEESDVIINVKFVDNNHLWIDYLTGENFDEKEEVIDLN